MSGASITANTVPAASIVNDSIGDAQIATAGVGQTSVASGYVDLANPQTIAGVKTFSSAPVHSGAAITSNTIPAASIVNKSIGDAQIALAGIGQTSVASGYVDLANAQTIAGNKTFSGTTAAQGLTCTSMNCSSAVDAGTLSCTTLTCSSVVDTGALSSTTISASGLISALGGLAVPGGQVFSYGFMATNAVQNAVTPAASLSITLNQYTMQVFTVTAVNTITSLAFPGAIPIANLEFDLFVTIGAGGVNINKALSTGGITIYNNLAGNTAAANNSRWWFQGKFVSSTILYLIITNVT
jgi:hypothetical protein